MSGLSYQRPVDSKFTKPKSLVIRHCWGQRWKLSQTYSKAEDDRRDAGNAADDLGQPASETDRHSCKEVFKVTKGLF